VADLVDRPPTDKPLAPSSSDDAHRDRWALLLVLGVAAGVILPLLGATGFFDPWETNYAEVARQMVVRDDYLYPFWKDAHFFSKPILLFWLTAPLYRVLGVGEAGPMPEGVELLGRLPSALIGLATVAVLFVVARCFWSRRAATLSALVLATTPYWAFLARQAITDMPYVGLSSMGLLLLLPTIFGGDEERKRLSQTRLPWWLLGVVSVCLVPQAWEIARSAAFFNRVDVFGSEWATRVVVGVVGVGLAMGFILLLRRRGRDPYLVGAALCFALSMLAKGPVGMALCGLVLVVSVGLVGGAAGLGAALRTMLRPGWLWAAALFLLVASPWPLVMLAYDGLDEARKTWFDRFIRYDLLGRVGSGVHGDRGGIEYYVRVLGFGMIPWVGLVPVAVVDGLNGLRRVAASREERLLTVATVWACAAFLFFSLITTKFHHYALPFTVPAALLVGHLLHRLADATPRAQLVVGGFAVIVGAIVLRELSSSPWEWIDLFTYHYKGYKPEYYFPVERLDVIELAGRSGAKGAPLAMSWFALAPSVAGTMSLALPVLLAVWQWARVGRGGGVLAEMLDVKEAMGRGLVVGAVVGATLLSVVAVQGFMGRASQHWSQRWLVGTWYATRQGDEPLIAFQMDWKGETFYSKNAEVQIKKNAADLRLAVERPGREFVLVQTDRLDGLKTALGPGGSSRVTVVDRSSAKWLLVVVD
jgi:4-amino-4-deoxy-L-arabinose transferase-like glycosyltransferase